MTFVLFSKKRQTLTSRQGCVLDAKESIAHLLERIFSIDQALKKMRAIKRDHDRAVEVKLIGAFHGVPFADWKDRLTDEISFELIIAALEKQKQEYWSWIEEHNASVIMPW